MRCTFTDVPRLLFAETSTNQLLRGNSVESLCLFPTLSCFHATHLRLFWVPKLKRSASSTTWAFRLSHHNCVRPCLVDSKWICKLFLIDGWNFKGFFSHDGYFLQHQDKSFSSGLVDFLTGFIWITLQIADQLFCSKLVLTYSNWKYDLPRRPCEMRVLDPRPRVRMFIRR